jgi:Putative transposase
VILSACVRVPSRETASVSRRLLFLPALDPQHEFIRRFLMHVLPAGFHRIRYYGLLASGTRAENIARARELLTLPVLPVDAIKATNSTADEPQIAKHTCPCCGGRMIIIERFERGSTPHSHSVQRQ